MPENAVETFRLLVVSRESTVLRPLWSIGEANSWQLETAGSGWEAMDRLQAGGAPHVLLLDLPRGDGDSLHVVRWLRRLRPELPIIVVAYLEDAGQKKEAMRLGAQGFVLRPFTEQQLEVAIRKHLNSHSEEGTLDGISENVEQLSDDAFFIGASPAMQKLRAQAELLAQASVPVLILGEPGSGRDTTARLIHKLSVRSGFRFVKVNCAALPGDLLEKELFGSANGDGRANPGRLELSDKGTLFLDDITEMPVNLQEKLLHVLQSKQIQKLGNAGPVDIDCRILAAADVNIERALAQNKLREDFYYRLSAFTVHVPPLRYRKDEISLLLQHFMHKLARYYDLPTREFSPAVLTASQNYEWPGNVRELENFVKRYLMIGDEDLAFGEPGNGHADNTKRSDFSQPLTSVTPPSDLGDEMEPSPRSLKSLVNNVKTEAERNAIAAALEKTGWNRKAAARLLKVSYRTILYKIEQYQMHSPHDTSSPYVNGNAFLSNGRTYKSNGRIS